MSQEPASNEVSQPKIPDHFSFKYTESGGLSNKYLLISFDSKTRLLKSSVDISGSNINQKVLNDSDENELLHVIRSTQNEFFKTVPDYSTEKEDKDDENLVLYSLTVTVNDDVHTTKWTNTSKDLPDGLMKIVDVIKKLSAKKKII
jgi:hypothetical protein